jgi:hypothetical protein
MGGAKGRSTRWGGCFGGFGTVTTLGAGTAGAGTGMGSATVATGGASGSGACGATAGAGGVSGRGALTWAGAGAGGAAVLVAGPGTPDSIDAEAGVSPRWLHQRPPPAATTTSTSATPIKAVRLPRVVVTGAGGDDPGSGVAAVAGAA